MIKYLNLRVYMMLKTVTKREKRAKITERIEHKNVKHIIGCGTNVISVTTKHLVVNALELRNERIHVESAHQHVFARPMGQHCHCAGDATTKSVVHVPMIGTSTIARLAHHNCFVNISRKSRIVRYAPIVPSTENAHSAICFGWVTDRDISDYVAIVIQFLTGVQSMTPTVPRSRSSNKWKTFYPRCK